MFGIQGSRPRRCQGSLGEGKQSVQLPAATTKARLLYYRLSFSSPVCLHCRLQNADEFRRAAQSAPPPCRFDYLSSCHLIYKKQKTLFQVSNSTPVFKYLKVTLIKAVQLFPMDFMSTSSRSSPGLAGLFLLTFNVDGWWLVIKVFRLD